MRGRTLLFSCDRSLTGGDWPVPIKFRGLRAVICDANLGHQSSMPIRHTFQAVRMVFGMVASSRNTNTIV